jgi:hypothetical protein
MTTAARENRGEKKEWFDRHADVIAILVTLLGFLARLWAAHGTFLNPDEALHFRLANQPSLILAYKGSLTTSHPPLLFALLYFWRAFGTSEVWLRFPSVIAGTTCCWMFYKWLAKAAGRLAGLIGLILAAFLPPVVLLAAEVRQYALLSAFLAGAIYFLDEAFRRRSSSRIAAFSLCLCLALLSQYSALLSIVALGVYALYRIFAERLSPKFVACWSIGQLVVLALAIFLYKTHLPKLGGAGDSALHGWVRVYIPHSYFDPAHDNPVLFVAGHSFGIFQYFFGQLGVGDVVGLLFVIAIVLLLRGKGCSDPQESRRLGVFLIVSFAVAASAGLAQFYPYGGTRHVAFLAVPALAGVSVAIARLAAGKWSRGVAVAAFIVVACVAFGKPRQPWMTRSDQSQAHMVAAMRFVGQNLNPADLILTDYQSGLILGNYLCGQRPISMEPAPAIFEQFSCGGHRIVAKDYRGWSFSADHFPEDWQRLVQAYSLKQGDAVWVFQAGWDAELARNLQNHDPAFRDLHFESFGKNITIFRRAVRQSTAAQ